MTVKSKKFEEFAKRATDFLENDNTKVTPITLSFTITLSELETKYYTLLMEIKNLFEFSDENIHEKIVSLGIDSVFKTLWGAVVMFMMKQAEMEQGVSKKIIKEIEH